MRRLLVLLPLALLAARMQVEWSWFQQFQLEAVLLRRWLLQLGFAAVAVLPVALAWWWSRTLNRQQDAASTTVLKGWTFSLCLITAIGFETVSVLALVLLCIQAIHDPINLAGGWMQAVSPGLLPVLSGIVLAAVLFPRL
ncbi:MAG: UPF0182 family protein, partial [Synechococcus sp.]|nr:UPF0182 family protein [Synechococcus sp.]